MDWNTFPLATWAGTEIEEDLTGCDKIEFAAAVMVEEVATGSPLFATTGNSCVQSRINQPKQDTLTQ
jgi:hypothetical protein